MQRMIHLSLEKKSQKMVNYRMLSILQMVSILIDKQIDRQVDKQVDRQMDRYNPFIFGKEDLENGELQDVINSLDCQQIERQIDRQINRQINRQIDRQIDRWIDMIHLYLVKNIWRRGKYQMLSFHQMVSRTID